MKWLIRLKMWRTTYLMLLSVYRKRLNLFHIFYFSSNECKKKSKIKTFNIKKFQKKCQWADLNRRPRRYECRALTNWATLTWIISYYFIALLSNYLINFSWIKMCMFSYFFSHLWYFCKYTSISFLILFSAFTLFKCFYSLSAAYPIAHV